jgi:hypothetical protein
MLSDNVYCDFGYLDEVLELKQQAVLADRLTRLVDKNPKVAGEAAARKCLQLKWADQDIDELAKLALDWEYNIVLLLTLFKAI